MSASIVSGLPTPHAVIPDRVGNGRGLQWHGFAVPAMRQGSRGRASCQPTGLNPAPSTVPRGQVQVQAERASLPGPNQGDPPEVESIPFRSQSQWHEQDGFRCVRQSAAGEDRKPLAAHAAPVRYTSAVGACLSFRERTVTRSLGTRLRLHTNM